MHEAGTEVGCEAAGEAPARVTDPTEAPGPFTGLAWLLLDGNNLLHRRGGPVDRPAQRTLLAELRAAVPAGVHAVLVLDGAPDPGLPFAQRIAPNLEVRHAGRVTADGLIVDLVRRLPGVERARTLLITDDRVLSDRVRYAGARTARLDWLEAVLRGGPPPARRGRPGGARPTTLGQGVKPPKPRNLPASPPSAASGVGEEDQHDRPPWQPGRGATRKRGNPKRGRS